VATAKRNLKKGEVLDGEGGHTVWGRLMAASDSMSFGALPIGLAHGLTLIQPIEGGEIVTWKNVKLNEATTHSTSYRIRRLMEKEFDPAAIAKAS
jgi:predicted homoserine dehydrogenase-like protein